LFYKEKSLIHVTSAKIYGTKKSLVKAVEELLVTLPQQASKVIVVVYREPGEVLDIGSPLKVFGGGNKFEVEVRQIGPKNHRNMVRLEYRMGIIEDPLLGMKQ
jgi:hypothetical protein